MLWPPEEEWSKTFGGTSRDFAYCIKQTTDGGYILAGEMYSYGTGQSDFWLVKTDSNGNEQWNKTFDGTDWDEARSVQQTADGGYILAGRTWSYGAGKFDFWLIKVNQSQQYLPLTGSFENHYPCYGCECKNIHRLVSR